MGLGIRINYVETKKAVENMFEDYELLKFRFEDAILPKMTTQNMLVYSKPTGRPRSKVESAVETREKLSGQIEGFINDLTKAFNRLLPEEREFLKLKFFSSIKLSDVDIMYKLNISKYAFAILKKASYKKLALAMGIEVYDK